MAAPKRNLRSNTPAQPPSPASTPLLPTPISFTTPSSSSPPQPIKLLPPSTPLPNLTSRGLSLLRRKQLNLASTAPTTLASLPPNSPLLNALASTLILAQHSAGTAVCIHPAGWILTCAHCFAETEAEYRADSKLRWMLFYTGLAVQVECRVWDAKRDLALGRIVAVEALAPPPTAPPPPSMTINNNEGGESIPTFNFIPVSTTVKKGTSIICIGQPGADDLESSSSRKTKYNLLEISRGTYRGIVVGADPNDNSEIGTLMHDAWTYWGHSGAPLVRGSDGALVGLHSSWDEGTGVRRGVPGVAIGGFLGEWMGGDGELVEMGLRIEGGEKGQGGGLKRVGRGRGDGLSGFAEGEVVVVDDSD